MKVLWFEVTTPSRYKENGLVIGGWQDSLENIVRECKEIELSIAFESHHDYQPKIIDGIKYLPLNVTYSKKETKKARTSWDTNANKLLPLIKNVIELEKPEVIHVFGTEWPFGLAAEVTNIPVVIHIQGAIIPYNNALFPPNYNLIDKLLSIGWKHPRGIKTAIQDYKLEKSREKIERRIWKTVSNYMGRTEWDKALSGIMHPNRKYFHVEEALRDSFINGRISWNPSFDGKIRLISTGCSTFWKGPDMLLKTARILTENNVDFEWLVAGSMPNIVKHTVEVKEKAHFEDCHIKFMGFIKPEELSMKLCASTIYVHTAYVENSPNSICEAQCLGIPVISTNVGGISSLIRDGIDGILVPANDPWQMAYAIIELAKDKEKMTRFSINSREFALKRHNPNNILSQLLACYRNLTS